MITVNPYLTFNGNCQEVFNQKKDADRVFNGLAEGGKITMPIADTFWGSYFGMVNDKFGLQWMVSFSESR